MSKPGQWWEANDQNQHIEYQALTPEQIQILVNALERSTDAIAELAEKSWSTLGLETSNMLRGEFGKLNRLIKLAFPDMK